MTDDLARATCNHERLGFASGGFYVQCADCGQMWTAGIGCVDHDATPARQLSMADLRLAVHQPQGAGYSDEQTWSDSDVVYALRRLVERVDFVFGTRNRELTEPMLSGRAALERYDQNTYGRGITERRDGYHWRDGWWFKQLADGSVSIQKFGDNLPYAPLCGEAVIPAAEWRSILATLPATPSQDDHQWSHDVLHDLVMLRAEEWALGGGPGIKERWEKAWRAADEIFEP